MAGRQRGSRIWLMLAMMSCPAVALAESAPVPACGLSVDETLVFTISDGAAAADVTISYRLLDDDALSLAVDNADACGEQSEAPVLFTPNRRPVHAG